MLTALLALLMRRRGMADQLIAKQLGRRDTSLVAARYGRLTPDVADVWAAAGILLDSSSDAAYHAVDASRQNVRWQQLGCVLPTICPRSSGG
jgi:hypothetical protein